MPSCIQAGRASRLASCALSAGCPPRSHLRNRPMVPPPCSSAEQFSLKLVGDQLVAFAAAEPAGTGAIGAMRDGQNVLYVLGDGEQVADDGDESAPFGLAAEGVQGLGEGVGLKGAALFVEEQ